MGAKQLINSSFEGINNPLPKETELTTQINHIIKYLTLPTKEITKYIPFKAGLMVSNVLLQLVGVYGMSGLSKRSIGDKFKCDNRSCDKAFAYLLLLGYVETIDKPRLIIPFNRHKIDKGYIITQSGIKVLKQLLED